MEGGYVAITAARPSWLPAHLNPKLAIIAWASSEAAGKTITTGSITGGLTGVVPRLREQEDLGDTPTLYAYNLTQLQPGTSYVAFAVITSQTVPFICSLAISHATFST